MDNLNSIEQVNSVSQEDYVLINKEKELKQASFMTICTELSKWIAVNNKHFPQAIVLDDFMKEISEKLFTLSTKDIIYDGEIHQEYGNLRAILTYILDQLSSFYDGGFKSENVTFIPDGDTPSHFSQESGGAKTIQETINYILNNYRYLGENIDSTLSDVDISEWDASLKPDGYESKNKITVQQAISQLYDIIAVQTKKFERLFYMNDSSIDFLNDNDIISMDSFTVRPKTTTQMFTMRMSFSIICNMPGVLTIKVFKDGTKMYEMEDALTSGTHTLNPFTFMNLPLREEPYTITMKATYQKDYEDDNADIAATIPKTSFTMILEGYDLEMIKLDDDGGES